MTDNNHAAPATGPAKVEITPEAETWRTRWKELTSYTMKYMVNRPDVYGRYNKGGRPYTCKTTLTPDIVSRHFRPRTPQDLIGLHTTQAMQIEGPDGAPITCCLSRWAAIDIDYHGDGDAPPANTLFAKHLHERATALGLEPLTYQSNGHGGYRVLIVFAEPIQTAYALSLARWLQADWRDWGFEAEPEYFPKQATIRLSDDPSDSRGTCGNWLRWVGRHHKYEHHSRFWDGQRTLVGNEAIDHLLAHCGVDPALIPAEALAFKPERSVGKVRESTPQSRPKNFDDMALAADALRSLKPMAESYDTWLKVGMCLHELGDCGLMLWDQWSKTNLEKYEAEACRKKWETFADAHKMNGRDGLALGSLFEFAKNQADWRYPRSGGDAPATEKKRKVILERISTIEEKPLEWLCPGRIPLATLTMLAGDMKLGKSLTLIYHAACASRGLPIHGETPARAPGNVILMAAEDPVAQVLRPRLRVCGADLDRVYILRSVLDPASKEVWPSLRQDIEAIEEEAGRLGEVLLLGIDPVTAYLSDVDDHRSAELRNVLLPLSRMAERLNCAVELVNHVGKVLLANAKHRTLGSVAYGGTCRANYLFAKDPDDPGRMLMMTTDAI
jgi:hypothetical protein